MTSLSRSMPKTQFNQIDFMCTPNQSSTPIHVAPKTRRGRRPTVPPEFREQIRRLKKQNMERRRRACISDKMNALHNLAMQLIGIDPLKPNKVEKTDILGVCYNIFDRIAKIVQEKPELLSRLQKLTSSNLKSNSDETIYKSISPTTSTLNLPPTSAFRKYNNLNSPLNELSYCDSELSPHYSSHIYEDSESNSPSDNHQPIDMATSLYKHYPFRMPLKYRLSPKSHENKSCYDLNPSQKPTEFQNPTQSVLDNSESPRYLDHVIFEHQQGQNQSNLPNEIVWRPYLD